MTPHIINDQYSNQSNKYVHSDIYDGGHVQVMAARIWLNGRIYLIDWFRTSLLYDKMPVGIKTFEEFKLWRALPKVPAGILKIPERL